MSVNDFKFQYYRTALLQTKRGNYKGIIINAKPILLLTLFQLINENKLKENKIYFNEDLNNYYTKISQFYESNTKVTPLHKPFYHLQNDAYWHLSYNSEFSTSYISANFVKKNVSFAFFDTHLWYLLNDDTTREYYKNLLINHFIRYKF